MQAPKEEGTLQADGKSIPTETAGPYREEVEPEVNAQTLGPGAADEPNRHGTNGVKESKDTVGPNPKRNENSQDS